MNSEIINMLVEANRYVKSSKFLYDKKLFYTIKSKIINDFINDGLSYKVVYEDIVKYFVYMEYCSTGICECVASMYSEQQASDYINKKEREERKPYEDTEDVYYYIREKRIRNIYKEVELSGNIMHIPSMGIVYNNHLKTSRLFIEDEPPKIMVLREDNKISFNRDMIAGDNIDNTMYKIIMEKLKEYTGIYTSPVTYGAIQCFIVNIEDDGKIVNHICHKNKALVTISKSCCEVEYIIRDPTYKHLIVQH